MSASGYELKFDHVTITARQMAYRRRGITLILTPLETAVCIGRDFGFLAA